MIVRSSEHFIVISYCQIILVMSKNCYSSWVITRNFWQRSKLEFILLINMFFFIKKLSLFDKESLAVSDF
jgi:hypothetical protein